jgi:hypothetical protein
MTEQSNRKLEIFVGATRRDLGLARQAVLNAILEKGHIPSGMELWAAGNRPPLDVVRGHLERCDAHILLIGARYGSSIDARDQVSFTEWEYLQSKDRRPILPFLFDAESLRLARKEEKDKAERTAERRGRLDKLRRVVLKERYVKEFHYDKKGFGELQKDAILAIDELVASEKTLANAGWIRGDSKEAKTVRDVASNPFLKRELDQLRRFSTLGARVRLDVASKKAMARSFWTNMQGRLRRHKYLNLFFESGSTVAYLGDEFGRTVLQPGESTEQWHIRTNNVLSLVYFDLHTPIDAARFPAGVPDPDDKYGAIFPNEWRHLEEPPPARARGLHSGRRGKEEWQAVEAMRKAFVGADRSHVALGPRPVRARDRASSRAGLDIRLCGIELLPVGDSVVQVVLAREHPALGLGELKPGEVQLVEHVVGPRVGQDRDVVELLSVRPGDADDDPLLHDETALLPRGRLSR